MRIHLKKERGLRNYSHFADAGSFSAHWNFLKAEHSSVWVSETLKALGSLSPLYGLCCSMRRSHSCRLLLLSLGSSGLLLFLDEMGG